MAINASGQVAGYANLTGDAAARAIIWNGTAVTELDTLGGAYSVAYGINDAGQAVGWSTIVGGAQHATLWNGTIATDLGTLGGYANSMGSAINGTGQVAGYSYTSDYRTYRATLWNGSTATDLNTLLDASSVDAGWVLTRANGINDSGSIVGEAVNTKSGVMHGFVLVSAVPEPETYGMLLAGLVLMGAVARRRKCVEAATDSFMEA
jgi:probable HAF family extracellular repeat protein